VSLFDLAKPGATEEAFILYDEAALEGLFCRPQQTWRGMVTDQCRFTWRSWTPMTRRNLSAEQIDRLTSATGFGRLASLEDVANVVCYLCSSENTGITGQFIAADLGFSRVRIV